MASSRRPRPWRSSSRRRSGLPSSSCSGLSADFADLAHQIALREIDVAEVHSPAGEEHPEYRDFAADAIGPLLAGFMVGADRQIPARAVVDAFARDQPLGANVGRRRLSLG